MTQYDAQKQQEVDIHRLELRYSHIRIQDHSRIRRLAESIARHGQLIPLQTVSGENDRLILIDGYQRYAALSQLGKDTALVVFMDCPEDHALFQLLIRQGERHLVAIEEAGIIQELYRRFDCTFDTIGSRIGRDKSYVKRRLDLLESLPEEILKHVLSGTVSTWSANRILVPLARANPDDAIKLTSSLEREPMSTRQLKTFYDHYQKSNRKVRKRMIESPGMFVKSLQAVDGTVDGGPEEKWLRDAKAVCGILRRLHNNTDTVFYPNQEKKQRRLLLGQAGRARRLTGELQDKIQERVQDDQPNHRGVNQGTEKKGNRAASNCQAPENISNHSEHGSLKSRATDCAEQGLQV